MTRTLARPLRELVIPLRALRLARRGLQTIPHRRALLGLALSALFLIIAWMPAIPSLLTRWWPSWGNVHLTLGQRLFERMSYYAHGPLVPLGSLLLGLLIYRRIGLPARQSRRAAAAGALLLLSGLLLHLVSVYLSVGFTSGFALMAVLAGLLLLWGGWPLARAYATPALLLAFMAPVPVIWLTDVDFALHSLVARVCEWNLNHLLDIAVLRDGSVLYFASATGAAPRQLAIADVAHAVRGFVAVEFLGAWLCASLPRTRLMGRWLLLLVPIPLLLLATVVQCLWIGAAVHAQGPSATDVSEVQRLWPLLAPVIVLLPLWAWMAYRTRSLRRPVALVGPFNRPGSEARPNTWNVPVLIVLAIVAVTSPLIAGNAFTFAQTKAAASWTPDSLQIAGQRYDRQIEQVDPGIMGTLHSGDLCVAQYSSPATADKIGVQIVLTQGLRSGVHAPEACLQYARPAPIVTDRTLRTIHLPSQDPRGRDVTMQELLIEHQSGGMLLLYVYSSNGRYTTSYVGQQADVLLDGVLWGSTNGARISLSVPILGGNVDRARRLALAAAQIVLQHKPVDPQTWGMP
ncbi:MAG: exosortase-associated EpsI family protein [Phycisphaeraceae bacterium]